MPDEPEDTAPRLRGGSETGPGAAPPARHRWAYLAAVAVAALTIAGGVVVAVTGYAATDTAPGVVRAYFGALERSDAPAALSYGPVPGGSHALLTSDVLEQQETLAPLGDVRVGVARPAATAGGRKTLGAGAVPPRAGVVVPVSYTLTYPAGVRHVHVTLALHRRHGSWQLASSAVTTRLQLTGAAQRATIGGGAIPAGPTAMFPGAVPVRFDSRYLQVAGSPAGVVPGQATTTVPVRVSRAGRLAMTAAAVGALRQCLDGTAPGGGDTCPLPDERYLPGSVRGRITGVPQRVSVTLTGVQTGAADFSADVPVRIRYLRLDFHNHVDPGGSAQLITVNASAVMRAPISISWTIG